MTPPVFVLAAASGLVLGSYAVTAGVRLARAEGSSFGRSHCDACGLPLGFFQTLPVVSYVSLRGACAGCGSTIDPIHLGGELAGAAVLISAVGAGEPWTAALMALLGLTLLAAATVDAKIKRLPDILTGVIAVASAGLAWRGGGAAHLGSGLIAAAVAAGILILVRTTSRKTAGEPGLGLGDVKLIAALALWLGAATPVMVAVAAGLGLATTPFRRSGERRMAFGPMIALAGWLVGVAVERGWLSWTL